MKGRDYAIDELLRDGRSIHIRAIRPDDKARLLDHFEHLSTRSVYFRFFNAKRRLNDEELRRFTELDFDSSVGLIATLTTQQHEQIIGVGRYFVLAADPRRAEIAFAVRDDYHGVGVGTLLLEHLGRIARAAGITEFQADVLGENNQMLGVFLRSGFRVQRALAGGVVHVSFPTAETEELIDASIARQRQAAAESVRRLLEPISVALVGASRTPGSIGAELLHHLRERFTGPLFAVNPAVEEIDGVRSYPALDAIGEPIGLVVIAVPAPAVEAIMAQCARLHVHGVVIISAGFGEVSTEGREAEARLRRMARESGMRMIGPNCMGILNTDPAVSLNATFAPTWPPAGNVGMLSQSGALGIAMLDYAERLNVGLSSFVSVGNKADVSGNDLISYWAADARTKVILLYLESFGNPRKFARLVPEVAREKPIVAVKSGRSAAGSRAASSHSAALASLDVAVDALFSQSGVIRTDTLEQLFDVTALLSTQPLPAGRRVAIVTNAGGPAILLADACAAQGLEVPELAEETRVRLRAVLPPQAGLMNPIDMIASATPEHYAQTIEITGNDGSVDAVIVIYIPVMQTAPDTIAAAIARGAAAVPADKPVMTVFLSAVGAPALLSQGPRGAIPSYSFPENAALALAATERYARWREQPQGEPLTFDAATRSAVRAVVERALNTTDGPLWMEAGDLATILRAIGIDMVATETVAVDECAEVAERLGYPLVAKAVAPNLLHKSDVGGVILDLHSAADVEHAVAKLGERMRAAGTELTGVLLQRQVEGGVEALVGVTSDPTFGPLIVAGLGGVLVELLKDVAFRLTPVTDLEAAAMLRELRASKLLDGYRGSPPADRTALESIILRVSALTEVVPELRELDLNPVKVLPPGLGAVVVDGRLRLARSST
jgi:acetyl coenzyme A synthetase (ADP forming)-like protein